MIDLSKLVIINAGKRPVKRDSTYITLPIPTKEDDGKILAVNDGKYELEDKPKVEPVVPIECVCSLPDISAEDNYKVLGTYNGNWVLLTTLTSEGGQLKPKSEWQTGGNYIIENNAWISPHYIPDNSTPGTFVDITNWYKSSQYVEYVHYINGNCLEIKFVNGNFDCVDFAFGTPYPNETWTRFDITNNTLYLSGVYIKSEYPGSGWGPFRQKFRLKLYTLVEGELQYIAQVSMYAQEHGSNTNNEVSSEAENSEADIIEYAKLYYITNFKGTAIQDTSVWAGPIETIYINYDESLDGEEQFNTLRNNKQDLISYSNYEPDANWSSPGLQLNSRNLPVSHCPVLIKKEVNFNTSLDNIRDIRYRESLNINQEYYWVFILDNLPLENYQRNIIPNVVINQGRNNADYVWIDDYYGHLFIGIAVKAKIE